jgi:predicted enzyme related to lactoylglutathione lyase
MGPMGTYTMFSRKGEGKAGQIGGMIAMPAEMKGVPSHWLVYFDTKDVDASVKKAETLGGKVVVPATDIPNIGRFAIVQDTTGAAFALYTNAH